MPSAVQVLKDAKAIDDAKAAGQDTGPLCGLAFAVKDNIDVLGYARFICSDVPSVIGIEMIFLLQ